MMRAGAILLVTTLLGLAFGMVYRSSTRPAPARPIGSQSAHLREKYEAETDPGMREFYRKALAASESHDLTEDPGHAFSTP